MVTFIWGSTFVVVKDALVDASPVWFIALRFMIAAAVVFLLMARQGVARAAIVPGTILGVFLFGGFILQTWGLKYTTPSKCAFITGFAVILVPVILLLGGSRMKKAGLAGGLLGLAGLYFLILPSGISRVNLGDALSLAGAVSFAFHIVLVGKYTRVHSFVHLVPVQVLTAGVLSFLCLPFEPARFIRWTPWLAFALVITGVLATAFAFSVQNWAQRFTPAAHTALIFALEPVFAALTSFLTGSEQMGGKVILGSALILAGMVVSELWGGTVPSPFEG
jgi:drug/metabolite transporter (DMT)-like permease